MPFMLLRTAAVLAVGFLMAGPSPAAPSAARTGGAAAGATAVTPSQCPAHWTADDLPIPPPPAAAGTGIQSVAVLSATDAFALLFDYAGPDVYHFAHGSWQKLPKLNSTDIYFRAVTIVADSDTDVWVIGEDEVIYPYSITFEAWHYDGSNWTDHAATLSPVAEILAAALGSNGVLYVVGSTFGPNGPNRGLVWAYDGSGWSDLTPASPRYRYDAVAVTADGTLVVGAINGLLQERGVVAVGQGDVWLLGQGPSIEQTNGNYASVPWITHFDGRRFTVAAAPGFAITGGVSLGPDIVAYGTALNPGTGGVTQTFIAVCPAQVTRDAIMPPDQRTPIGAQMFWSVPTTGAGSRHELVAPGMFDSGPLSPGGSFEEDLFAAATYRVRDTSTGAVATVAVQAEVTPANGATNTVFTVTCASLQAPAGYAYRLLVERPGAPRYTLLTTTSQPTTTFLPYHGTGTYRFECQVQTPEGVTSASPPAAITVSSLKARRSFLSRKSTPKREFSQFMER